MFDKKMLNLSGSILDVYFSFYDYIFDETWDRDLLSNLIRALLNGNLFCLSGGTHLVGCYSWIDVGKTPRKLQPRGHACLT